MSTFGWGILGTGNIAGSMAAALRLVRGAKLRAVASRTQGSADAFAARWNVPAAYADYASMLADPDVQIIYVATPNAFHKQNILDALTAGKHVLCEKPLTLSAEDSEHCAAAAKAAGLFLMEAMWTAFFPGMQRAVELVQSGAIGTPRHLTANFVSYRDPEQFPNLFDPSLGGGATLDLGIYPVAAAQLLAGPVAGAAAQVVRGATGVDEMVALSARHENGVISQLSFGFRVKMPIAVTVVGSDGSLILPQDFHKPSEIVLVAGSDRRHLALPPLGEGYAHEAEAVQTCIEEGRIESLTWPLSRTIACAQLLEMAAAQSGWAQLLEQTVRQFLLCCGVCPPEDQRHERRGDHDEEGIQRSDCDDGLLVFAGKGQCDDRDGERCILDARLERDGAGVPWMEPQGPCEEVSDHDPEYPEHDGRKVGRSVRGKQELPISRNPGEGNEGDKEQGKGGTKKLGDRAGICVEPAQRHPDAHRDQKHEQGRDDVFARDFEIERRSIEQEDQRDQDDPEDGRGDRHQDRQSKVSF